MKRRLKIGKEGDRETCYSCFRPKTHCVCSLIAPFEAHTNILILQHPNERRKYYGTAKLVAKGITNARILTGIEFAPGAIQQAIGSHIPYLLFPSLEAKDCESVVLDKSATVVVIDGTWHEAKKIVFRNPFLKTFPALSFKHQLRSNYRIRKQPREGYLSTIESIGHLLQLNAEAHNLADASRSYDALFDGFSKMVEQQLTYEPPKSFDGLILNSSEAQPSSPLSRVE